MPRRAVLAKWRANPRLLRAGVIITANAAALGLAALLGGDDRFSARAYAVMRDLGGWAVWGTALLVGAVLLGGVLILRRRPLIWAVLIGAGTVYTLIALWLFSAARADDLASYWGAINFVTLAAMCAHQALEYRRPRE